MYFFEGACVFFLNPYGIRKSSENLTYYRDRWCSNNISWWNSTVLFNSIVVYLYNLEQWF